ncbi:hypothetical protein KR222_008946, partial [Zaprionus bogoriensis]
AINFHGREIREGERDQIVMNAALNTVDFEVEGTPSVTAETIIFNSNCIWECDMAGIKRIKTDHRPVKVTFFACTGSKRTTIGSLLLPVRGIPVLGVGGNNSALQLKMFWHKLICISSEFRSHKPEVLLMLAIIKKTLLHTKDFKHLMVFSSEEKQSRSPPLKASGHSITANMLQSQANVYVQSLVQLGLLQVGNNPLVDCDIIEVVLQFKQLKNVNKFVKSVCYGKDVNTVLLMFDFVGNVTNIELKLNDSDCYLLDDVLGLRFKSSLRSILLYFQRIFYLPINMYINGTSIANYRMDFSKLMPSDKYFADSRKYVHSGYFAFERFGRMGSARELKPIMEFTFTVDIQEVCWKGKQSEQVMAKEQRQQPYTTQEVHSQLDLNSVDSKAVIHEVPKDRIAEKAVEWQKLAEDNASIGSLDVGAELSNSEPEMFSATEISDDQDSNGDSNFNGRRKKFTRLRENKYASHDRSMEQKNANEVDSLKGFECNDELICPDECNVTGDIIETPKDSSQCYMKDTLTVKNTKLNSKLFQDEKLPKEFEPRRAIAKLSSEDNEDNDVANQIKDNLCSELTLADHQKRIVKPKIDEGQPKAVLKARKSIKFSSLNETEKNALTDLIDEQCKTAIRNKKPIADNSMNLQQDEIEKTKKSLLKNEECGLLQTAQEAKTVKKSNIGVSEEYLSEDNAVKADGCKELKSEKPRRKIAEEHSQDVEITKDIQKVNLPGNKSATHKSKTRLSIPTESKVVVDYSRNTKETFMRESELGLSARWVDINKEQARELEETERFMGHIGIYKDISGEDHSSDSYKKSIKNKLHRSAENNEYFGGNLSSETDNSNKFKEVKGDSRVMKKKMSRNFISGHDSSEIDVEEYQKASKAKKMKDGINLVIEKPDNNAGSEYEMKLRHIARRQRSSVEESYTEDSIIHVVARERPVKKKTSRSSLSQPDLQNLEASVNDIISMPIKKRKEVKETFQIDKDYKPNLDTEAQVSRLEVMVNMSDQLKAKEAAKRNLIYLDQSVNTDMDESLRKILAAGMLLGNDMQQKALEFMQKLGQEDLTTAHSDKLSVKCLEQSTGVDYKLKFKELEQHISVLEDHLHQFESRTMEMQEENSKLAQEKAQLKQRITSMEMQIVELRSAAANANELQEVLSEIRQQNGRYQDVLKAKDHYKKQWRHAARRVHALKLAIYDKNL